jgi:hypothetical protein
MTSAFIISFFIFIFTSTGTEQRGFLRGKSLGNTLILRLEFGFLGSYGDDSISDGVITLLLITSLTFITTSTEDLSPAHMGAHKIVYNRISN